ncbi:MAG: RodZ domain-containing protein [Anaerolineales bacterium]|jgi:cytoskeletal protein RodZ
MPETIGQQLKAAREARNLTLEKVTQVTHIQARLLEAMEADDFETLPSPVQARAFLRSYAGFLGLSLDEMIARQRLAAGEPATAVRSGGSVSSQGSEPVGVSVQADTAEPVGEPQADNSFSIKEKIMGLLVRLRKPAKAHEETSGLVESNQPNLPLVESKPVIPLQADSGGPLAEEQKPVDAVQTEPLEEATEEPVEDWQEESSQATRLSGETQESQRIFGSIGQTLRQRRESLSLTLDEIERHTHVRKHYLQALERGDFDHLPSSVQTRGMLNNYAHFLDMDVDAILLQFAEGLQAKRMERQPAPAESRPNTTTKFPPRMTIPARLRRFLSMDILVGGGLILILFAFAIWGTSRVISLHAAITPQSTAQSISDILAGLSGTVTLTPTPSLAGTATVIPTAGVTAIGTIPAAGPGPVQIVIVALEQAYLRVTVDGKIQFDGRIMIGTAYSFSGNTQIEVLTGNGAGISILFNQGNLGPMGRFGEVVDRIYTANAILNPTATNTPTPTITLTPTITPRESPTPTQTNTPLVPPATP